MRFQNRRPAAKNVVTGLGERVDEIIKNTRPAYLDLGIAPKINVEGKIIGFEPSAEIVKRETRRYAIFGKVLEVEGTVYGIDKNETTGKYGGTYFMPDMVEGLTSPEFLKRPNAEKELLKNTFDTIVNLLQLVKDMQWWQMPARTLSKVANEGVCKPEFKDYIGEKYASNLITGDDEKFTRVMFLQYLDGEIDINKDLIDMTAGNIAEASYVPASTDGISYTEGDSVESIITDVKKVGGLGHRLAAHGNIKNEGFKSRFSNGMGIKKAGDAALGAGLSGGLKKK